MGKYFFALAMLYVLAAAAIVSDHDVNASIWVIKIGIVLSAFIGYISRDRKPKSVA